MLKSIAILVLLSAVASAQNSGNEPSDQIDYFSSANILKFADHLYETGYYLRASGEYQRYLIAVSYKPSSDSIYYKMIRALYFGEDYWRCRQHLDSYASLYPQSPRLAEIDFYRAIICSRQGDYELSNMLLSTATTRNFPLKSLIKAVNFARLGEFESARNVACIIDESFVKTDRRVSADLADLCRRLQSAEFDSKSPSLAAALAVVPGAGRLYCGNTGDALNSLFIIGLFGYLAYDGFHDDGESSIRGWVFGTLGFGFYAGNIYGSAIAARLYNQKVKDDFIAGINIDVSLP